MISFERELSTAWMDAHYPSPSEPEQLPEPVQVAQAGGAAFGVFPAMKSKASRTGEISEVAKMAPADIAAGAGKGLITGGIGTPGDLESLIRGVRSIFTRTGDVTKVDAFLSGLEEKTILPTSSDVSRWLDENIGPVVPPTAPMAKERAGVAEAGQLAGELVSGPGTLVKGGKAAAKTAAATGKFVKPKVGEMLDAYMRRSGMQLELTAYHGTPHRFAPEEGAPLGRFRSEKIGTGEGAQAFGYGLYFAENPAIAGTYAISRGIPDVEGIASQRGLQLTKDARIELMRQAKADRSAIDAAKMLQNASRDTRSLPVDKLAETIDAYREAARGSLYTVDIPDEMVGKMLDWDTPLSEQPESVKNAIYGAVQGKYMTGASGERRFIQPPNANMSGGAAYARIVRLLDKGEAEASNLLRKQGIPGIRYLDAGSRDGGAGARNIVVFPGGENQIKIIKAE